MNYEIDTTDEVGQGGGEHITNEGTYHCAIDIVSDAKGGPGFAVKFTAMAGTVPEEKDKSTQITFWAPDLSKSEASQTWSKRKQTAFLIAAGLVAPADLGQRFSVDFSVVPGRQCILQIEHGTDRDGNKTKYMDLSYDNIYHVDDPRAKAFPKNADALALIPTELRKPESYFDPITKKNGKTNTTDNPASANGPALGKSALSTL